jgi:hypothetical protein
MTSGAGVDAAATAVEVSAAVERCHFEVRDNGTVPLLRATTHA